jgi:hypothetical protein
MSFYSYILLYYSLKIQTFSYKLQPHYGGFYFILLEVFLLCCVLGFFAYFVIAGLELKALSLRGKCSTT